MVEARSDSSPTLAQWRRLLTAGFPTRYVGVASTRPLLPVALRAQVAGCLWKLLLVGVFMFAALVAAASWFTDALFQGF